MPAATESLMRRAYTATWRILVDALRVPRTPPTLPTREGESLEQFRPAEGFLRYLKFWFWLALLPMDAAVAAAWIAVTAYWWQLGLILAPLALFLAIAPDVIAYVALHVRYDTTWYVMTPRSIRIRRGIWVIQEVTIAFENVQNVTVRQGPLQRYYGIANVTIETAGAGGGEGKHQSSITNQGIIEGLADAHRIRDLILHRLRQTKSTGLGDEEAPQRPPGPVWTREHVAVLREIRDVLAATSS